MKIYENIQQIGKGKYIWSNSENSNTLISTYSIKEKGQAYEINCVYYILLTHTYYKEMKIGTLKTND